MGNQIPGLFSMPTSQPQSIEAQPQPQQTYGVNGAFGFPPPGAQFDSSIFGNHFGGTQPQQPATAGFNQIPGYGGAGAPQPPQQQQQEPSLGAGLLGDSGSAGMVTSSAAPYMSSFNQAPPTSNTNQLLSSLQPAVAQPTGFQREQVAGDGLSGGMMQTDGGGVKQINNYQSIGAVNAKVIQGLSE